MTTNDILWIPFIHKFYGYGLWIPFIQLIKLLLLFSYLLVKLLVLFNGEKHRKRIFCKTEKVHLIKKVINESVKGKGYISGTQFLNKEKILWNNILNKEKKMTVKWTVMNPPSIR